jgi:hypothetical protein
MTRGCREILVLSADQAELANTEAARPPQSSRKILGVRKTISHRNNSCIEVATHELVLLRSNCLLHVPYHRRDM